MNIKTKLNLRQIAFTIYNGKIYSGSVQSIDTHTGENGKTRISYVIGGRGGAQSPATCGRDEHEVFASEKELLAGSKEVVS